MSEGVFLGDICNRNGCGGVICNALGRCECSVSPMPPCSRCENGWAVCPECGWDESEEREQDDLIDDQVAKARTLSDEEQRFAAEILGEQS